MRKGNVTQLILKHLACTLTVIPLPLFLRKVVQHFSFYISFWLDFVFRVQTSCCILCVCVRARVRVCKQTHSSHPSMPEH